jgi:hypothetical protein
MARTQRALRRWVAASAAVAAAACDPRGHRDRRRDLTLRIEGGALDADGAVSAPAAAAPVVRFSDGSEIALRPGGRLHVRSIDGRGARVTLDRGEAHVYVVHAPDTRWAFEAGPFVVAVTGTAFGLAWREGSGRLDVRLENGAVTVTGPPSDAPLSLHAGQWLTVRGADVTIRGLDARESGEPAELAEPSADARSSPGTGAIAGEVTTDAGAAQPSVSGESSPASAPVRRAPAERTDRAHGDWRRELAAGEFQAIVDEAVRLGLETELARSSSDDLAALADAARYTRHGEIARGAFEAQRRRFAGSEHARAAAFLLGRMAEADGDARRALEWYDAYLGEAPDGTYSPEALGRKMVLVERVDGRGAARPLAEAYLRRFRSGPYADAARSLISDAP